jgi:hypothetical protein
MAARLGRFQCFAGQAARLILQREKSREMLTVNFFATIAFDLFGARVPGHDEPVRIERANGVVRNYIDEQR